MILISVFSVSVVLDATIVGVINALVIKVSNTKEFTTGSNERHLLSIPTGPVSNRKLLSLISFPDQLQHGKYKKRLSLALETTAWS